MIRLGSVPAMVDLDAAIGFVVAHGDPVDRARLSWLRSGAVPPPEVFEKVEMGQTRDGGWPAFWAGDVASVDATCFRLGELDDLGGLDRPPARPEENEHAMLIARAAEAFRAEQRPDGSWPSFLATGWLGGALLYHLGWFYEAAQIQVLLTDRVPEMSPADCAWMGAAFRRVGISADDWVMTAVRRRLGETQRHDGGWPSDDGDAFDVHATLTAIRALR